MIKSKLKIAVSAAILAGSFGANAASNITFNGFASIKGGVMFEETKDQGSMPYTDEISFKPESIFGLQAQSQISDDLSATIQLVSEGKNDFEVEARWAYLTYKLDDTHSIQLGHLANPVYYMAEYDKVGYAQNTRLPQAVYQPIAFNTIEGVALNSRFFVEELELKTKLIYGSWDGEAFLSSTGKWEPLSMKNLIGANAELASEHWKLFAGGHVSELSFEKFNTGVLTPIAQGILDEANSGIQLVDANGNPDPKHADFIDTIGWDGKTSFYIYAGASAEYNNFLFNAELSRAGVESSTDAIDENWYASIGYRHGNFIYTYTVEEFKQDSNSDFASGITNSDLRSAGTQIKNMFGQRTFDGQMFSIRYDFQPKAALKLDYVVGESNTGKFSGITAGVDVIF